jgi:hypothetical protein
MKRWSAGYTIRGKIRYLIPVKLDGGSRELIYSRNARLVALSPLLLQRHCVSTHSYAHLKNDVSPPLASPPHLSLLLPPCPLETHAIPTIIPFLHLKHIRTQPKRLQYPIPQILQLPHHLADFFLLGHVYLGGEGAESGLDDA